MPVSDYSTVPASNVSIGSINIGEGCAPGNLNNALRQLMADLKGYDATVIPFSRSEGWLADTVQGAIVEAFTKARDAVPGAATTTTDGIMTAVDKVKLNGITAGAGVTPAIAPQSVAIAGTNNTDMMTPLRTEQHMVAHSLGWDQTWQDMTSSRYKGASYRNTTGRPIMVNVTFRGGGSSLQVSIDGSSWVSVGYGYENANDRTTSSAVVPDNHYYRVTSETYVINSWAELR